MIVKFRLLNVLIPLDTSLSVVSSQLDEEVLRSEERLQFHLDVDVLGLGILVNTLQVVVLNQLAWAFVVTQEVVDGLLQFSFHR